MTFFNVILYVFNNIVKNGLYFLRDYAVSLYEVV